MWTPADLTVSLEIILSKTDRVFYIDIILVTGFMHAARNAPSSAAVRMNLYTV